MKYKILETGKTGELIRMTNGLYLIGFDPYKHDGLKDYCQSHYYNSNELIDNRIIEFFDNEKISYGNEKYFDGIQSIYFWAYGEKYSITHKTDGYTFCCKLYITVESLITAIDKKCRGNDGTFGS